VRHDIYLDGKNDTLKGVINERYKEYGAKDEIQRETW